MESFVSAVLRIAPSFLSSTNGFSALKTKPLTPASTGVALQASFLSSALQFSLRKLLMSTFSVEAGFFSSIVTIYCTVEHQCWG